MPLSVSEVFDGDESQVPTDELFNFIQQFREIELETQRDTMFEMGEISDPAQFEPVDNDWTQ